MSEFGARGPFKHGTTAQRAALSTGDLRVGDLFLDTDTGDMYRCSNATGPVLVPFKMGSVPQWSDPLATLQGYGTDDGLAVGHRGWDETNLREVRCATAAASSSTWVHSEWQTVISTWWSNVATLVYVPWGADLEYPTITAEHVSYGPMPCAGEVEDAWFYCTGAAGSTILGYHKNDNTTATVTDTQTVSASTNKQFDWAGSATWAQGDRFHVSIDPTASELVSFLTLRLRFDWE